MLRLKELRKSKKLTQQQVAEIINTTTTCYNYYEKEKREPSIEILCKLADYYNVSIDYLVGREFTNDIGYLSTEQKNVVYAMKQLNDYNLSEILNYTLKLLNNQNK